MSRQPALAALALLILTACAPTAPKGTDKATLDGLVDRAIGDPNSCVLIARPSEARAVYRYNQRLICDRGWPACDGPGQQTVNDLLAAVAKDGKARTASCPTNPDGSRGVAWAAGPITGQDLVYAAVMEGDRALPGRIMAERLAIAFKKAGL
jgi:hypothetical protein